MNDLGKLLLGGQGGFPLTQEDLSFMQENTFANIGMLAVGACMGHGSVIFGEAPVFKNSAYSISECCVLLNGVVMRCPAQNVSGANEQNFWMTTENDAHTPQQYQDGNTRNTRETIKAKIVYAASAPGGQRLRDIKTYQQIMDGEKTKWKPVKLFEGWMGVNALNSRDRLNTTKRGRLPLHYRFNVDGNLEFYGSLEYNSRQHPLNCVKVFTLQDDDHRRLYEIYKKYPLNFMASAVGRPGEYIKIGKKGSIYNNDVVYEYVDNLPYADFVFHVAGSKYNARDSYSFAALNINGIFHLDFEDFVNG